MALAVDEADLFRLIRERPVGAPARINRGGRIHIRLDTPISGDLK
jgi:hypothetical protein